jgi:hypothetical protein
MPAILATWGAEIRRMEVQDKPVQKVSETPFQSISWYEPVIPVMQEA